MARIKTFADAFEHNAKSGGYLLTGHPNMKETVMLTLADNAITLNNSKRIAEYNERMAFVTHAVSAIRETFLARFRGVNSDRSFKRLFSRAVDANPVWKALRGEHEALSAEFVKIIAAAEREQTIENNKRRI